MHEASQAFFVIFFSLIRITTLSIAAIFLCSGFLRLISSSNVPINRAVSRMNPPPGSALPHPRLQRFPAPLQEPYLSATGKRKV